MNLKTSAAIQAQMLDELLETLNKYKIKVDNNKIIDSERSMIEALYLKMKEYENELFNKGYIDY